MSTHLDLEEQEQIDELKHFWGKWGRLFSGALTVIALSYVTYTGWHYWQRQQSSQAVVMFDNVTNAIKLNDKDLLKRSLIDFKDKFGSTIYASQAALLAAQALNSQELSAEALAELKWVAEQSSDQGLKAIARLRMSALLTEKKQLAQARDVLSVNFPQTYQALVDDRLGDLSMLEGQPEQAKELFLKAWLKLDPKSEYRRLVEIKLAALGADPKSTEGTKP